MALTKDISRSLFRLQGRYEHNRHHLGLELSLIGSLAPHISTSGFKADATSSATSDAAASNTVKNLADDHFDVSV